MVHQLHQTKQRKSTNKKQINKAFKGELSVKYMSRVGSSVNELRDIE